MPEFPPLELPENPKLTTNLTHFARALRAAGLPVGPGKVIEATRAIALVGFSKKSDFYWVLHSVFVSRPEHRAVFQKVFRLFWRDPRYLEHMMAMMLPAIRGVAEEHVAKPGEKRAAGALLDGVMCDVPEFPEQEMPEIQVDASCTQSGQERLRSLDFEQMNMAEIIEAKRMLSQLTLPIKPLVSRRYQAAKYGNRADWARTLRRAMRTGGDVSHFARKRHRMRWPNLVVLCDISGSMSAYSRMVLHFLHAVSNQKGAGWAQVHGFTFGTELTNITRHLAHRDVDAALAAAGQEAHDWEGGTRIGACLKTFNRDWARRVLGQGSVVILITDGLDRDAPEILAREMQRLSLSARHLIWLNPLLRWTEFAPKAAGIRAMLPHVDSFRAGHNITALEGLAKAISMPSDPGEKTRLMAML